MDQAVVSNSTFNVNDQLVCLAGAVAALTLVRDEVSEQGLTPRCDLALYFLTEHIESKLTELRIALESKS